MTYGTATITSATPAKDIMAALGTALTAGGLSFVETYQTPTAVNWSSVTYSGTQFVAVAAGTSMAATSPDGVTWTSRVLPSSGNWSSVTYGGGQYVAVCASSAVAATSPDGITWTQRALPSSQTWNAVTYGGGQYVAVAGNNSAVAATSLDGITWTQRALPTAAYWTSVTYGGNGLFVAVGQATACATSPDGITWTTRTLAFNTWASVIYANSLYVAVSTGGATLAATSPDGITWTTRTLPVAGAWTSVAYGGGLFVTVNQSGTAASSPDGITWTARAVAGTGVAYSAITYGAGQFCTVGTSVPSAVTSPNGITWTVRVLPAGPNVASADVYRSPAASNQSGADWYLVLRRGTDAATALYYQVAESYSTATHLMGTYGGTAQAVLPLPPGYANPQGAATPESLTGNIGLASNAQVALALNAAFTYWYSVTANRVIVAVKATVEQGFYAGLYDDLLPAGVTGFPLAAAKFPTVITATGAIGYGGAPGTGGFTREPGALTSTTTNLEAAIHNGYWNSNSTNVAGNYTPMTTGSALYGNTGGLSRVMIGTTRTAATLADAVRGLLIGCVCSSVSSVAGDTITAGGKTYVRFTGPTTTYGYFVDQAL